MNPQSWNRYAYVLNNPMALVDPFGLDPVCYTLSGGAVACPAGYAPGSTLPTGSVPQSVDVSATPNSGPSPYDASIQNPNCPSGYVCISVPGGPTSSTGSNAGGSTSQPVINTKRLECAIKAAQGGSIAGVIGQNDNPYANALLGNQVADLAQTGLDVYNSGGWRDYGKAAWGYAVGKFAGKQVDAAEGAALAAFTYKNKALARAVLGKGTSGATNLLKVGAKLVGYGKLGGDALFFLLAYEWSCAAYGN